MCSVPNSSKNSSVGEIELTVIGFDACKLQIGQDFSFVPVLHEARSVLMR